jgi:cytochrome c5
MRTLRVVAPVFSLCLFSVALFPLAFQAKARAAQPSSAPPNKRDERARPEPSSDGQRVFEQNCARCHSAPEGFSPSISGTIARHMRVRANLSQDDERALLKFLNP